jgi:hypothetical protein
MMRNIVVRTARFPAGVQGAEIPELKAAEGTVVEREPKQAQQTPEGIKAHRVDSVAPFQPAEFEAVAFGAIRMPLENCEEGAIKITVGSAVIAVKSGTARHTAEYAAALADIHLSANSTSRIYSAEEQMEPELKTDRKSKA